MKKNTMMRFWAFIGLLLFFGINTTAFADSDNVKNNVEVLKKTKACPNCDLKGAMLNRMNLSGANLQGADLTGAKLFLTNLSGANLKNAHLQRAIFGGADLAGADLRGADLTGADISTAYLVGAKLDGEFIKTKPYEKELSELEKSTYVDDTVRPKKIDDSHPVSRISKESETTIKKEKMKTVANKELAHKSSEQGPVDMQTTKEQQVESSAPMVKKVTPIKKVVIEKEVQTSNKANTATENKKENNFKKVADNPKKEHASSTQIKKETETIAKINPDKAEIKNEISSSQHAVEEDQKLKGSSAQPKVTAAGGLEKKNTEDKEPVVEAEKKPESKEEIIEKDIASKEKNSIAEHAVTGSHSAKKMDVNDKEKNLKRLLDTNECYHCDLAGLDLSGKSLDGADLEEADLTGCNLENADLSEAILKGAILVNANLKKANLEDADLYKANFTNADLTGAKMDNTKVDDANFTEARGLHK